MALALFTSAPAHAFCRTTTCDPFLDCDEDAEHCCGEDSHGCAVNGEPLHWSGPCISFSAQEDGSEKRNIGFEELRTEVRAAFRRWVSSDCGNDQLPGLKVADFGAAQCGRPEYNTDVNVPNANVWMFRDGDWPHEGQPNATLALSTITYHLETGEIFDADVEINSFAQDVTVGDDDVNFDLASIVTHEAGHFLGLSHTRVRGSAMVAGYTRGSTALRELSEDDEAGMCAIYEPTEDAQAENCEPRHGYSPLCADALSSGCQLEPGGTGAGPLSAAKVGFLFWVMAAARRRRPRASATPTPEV